MRVVTFGAALDRLRLLRAMISRGKIIGQMAAPAQLLNGFPQKFLIMSHMVLVAFQAGIDANWCVDKFGLCLVFLELLVTALAKAVSDGFSQTVGVLFRHRALQVTLEALHFLVRLVSLDRATGDGATSGHFVPIGRSRFRRGGIRIRNAIEEEGQGPVTPIRCATHHDENHGSYAQ